MSEDKMDIGKWEGRLRQSEDQQWVKDGIKKRTTYTKWFHSEFWGNHAALDKAEPGELNVHRDVNYISAWIRMLQATMYAQDPTVSCMSPWHPPMFRQVLSEFSTRLLPAVGFRDVAKLCYQDAGLGAWGASRVGYEPALGWSGTAEADQKKRAQASLEKLVDGNMPQVDETQDHEIWADIYEQYARELMQKVDPTGGLPIIQELQILIKKHLDAQDKEPISPIWYIKDRRCWVARIEPVIEGSQQMVWEVETSIEDASWVAVKWTKTLDEVKAAGEKGYFEHTEGLEASELNKRGSKEWLEANADRYGDHFGRDVKMVSGWDVYDREHNEKLVIVPGHGEYLFKNRFAHADILKGAGIHVLTLAKHESYEPGITPLDAAASDIDLICKTEGLLAVILQKTVPGLVYNRNSITPEDVANIMKMNAGEMYGADLQGDTKMRDVFTETPYPRLYEQTMAVIHRAEARMSMNLGMGDVKLSGNERSKTATAASLGGEADQANTQEWARQGEDWCNANVTDLVQLGKTYYGPKEVEYLLGPEMGMAWPDPWPDDLRLEQEVFEVNSGSTLPGREEADIEKRLAIFDRLSMDPMVDPIALRKWAFKGLHIPDAIFAGPEAMQVAGQQTPGPDNVVMGGAETGVGGPMPDAGNGQPDATQRMQSRAGELAAEQR